MDARIKSPVYPTDPEIRGVNLIDWSKTQRFDGKYQVWVECRECPTHHGRWVDRHRVSHGGCKAAGTRRQQWRKGEKSRQESEALLRSLQERGVETIESGSTVFWARVTTRENTNARSGHEIMIPYQCVCGKSGERRHNYLSRSYISHLFLCRACNRIYGNWLELKDLGLETLLSMGAVYDEYLHIPVTRNHPYSEMASFSTKSPFGRGSVSAHRYVMAHHVGRALREDEVVHHRDSTKLNNHISNLQLMTADQHTIETRVESLARKELRLENKELRLEKKELKKENTFLRAQLAYCICQ